VTEHVGPRRRKRYRIMCQDQWGNDLVMTFALTATGKAVVAKRETGPALVMMAPRVVREMINCLRDLEAQTYEGDTW
jgi:hypothetical protein